MRFRDAVAAPAAVALTSYGAGRTAWWWQGADRIGTTAGAGIVGAAFIGRDAVAGPAAVGDTCDGVGWANRRHGETIDIAGAAAWIRIYWNARWRALAAGITLFNTSGAWCAGYRRASWLLVWHALDVAGRAAHGFTGDRIAWKAAFFAVSSRTAHDGFATWGLVRDAGGIAGVDRWRFRRIRGTSTAAAAGERARQTG